MQELILSRETDPTFTFVMLGFAERMANETVRKQDLGFARDGLRAILVENCRTDWREDAMVLTVLCDSIRRVDGDPREMLRSVSQIAIGRGAALLVEYSKKSPERIDIREMGYRAGESRYGFRYVRVVWK